MSEANENVSNTVDFKEKITEGFRILILREFGIKILAFAGQLFLARLLSPEAFGTYAIVIFIITLCNLFSDIGLSPAIIQKKTIPTQTEVSTIFFIRVILSLLLIGIINILAPILPVIYSSFESSYISMVRVLSLTLLLTAIRSLPSALLERDLHYNIISTIDIIGIVVYYISAIVLALTGFGVWSFIIGVLMKEVIEVCIVFFYKRWLPSVAFDFSKVKKMLHFGAFIQAGGIVNYFYTAMIPVAGGIKGGAHSVGLLDWAFNITLIPESITNNFSRVAFAVFPKLQHDKELLKKAMTKSIGMLLIISLFFVVMIYGLGEEAIKLIYTEQWLAGIPSLYWFAASIPLFAVIACYSQAILSLGKSRAIFLSTFVANSIGMILAFLLVYFIGFIGVAIASTISVCLLCAFYMYITSTIHISINLLQITLPKFFAAILSYSFIIVLNMVFDENIYLLVVKFFLVTLFYIITMFTFSHEEMKELFLLLKQYTVR